jgi:hypothetical protein
MRSIAKTPSTDEALPDPSKAVAAALISDLATVPQKRDLFAKLAAHLNTLAAEVERAMAAANEAASVMTSDTGPSKPSSTAVGSCIAKSSKLTASKRGKVLR